MQDNLYEILSCKKKVDACRSEEEEEEDDGCMKELNAFIKY